MGYVEVSVYGCNGLVARSTQGSRSLESFPIGVLCVG